LDEKLLKSASRAEERSENMMDNFNKTDDFTDFVKAYLKERNEFHKLTILKERLQSIK
jgi:hypothetical protein